MRVTKLVITKEDVLYPNSKSFKSTFESLPFYYEDDDGKVKKGSYTISFLGNNKYDCKINPEMPEYMQACIWNSFFGQFNKFFNETFHPNN